MVEKVKEPLSAERKALNEDLMNNISNGEWEGARAALSAGADPLWRGVRSQKPALSLAAQTGNTSFFKEILKEASKNERDIKIELPSALSATIFGKNRWDSLSARKQLSERELGSEADFDGVLREICSTGLIASEKALEIILTDSLDGSECAILASCGLKYEGGGVGPRKEGPLHMQMSLISKQSETDQEAENKKAENLIKHMKVDPNEFDDGVTPMMLVAEMGFVWLARTLFENGAREDLKAADGRKASDFAKEAGFNRWERTFRRIENEGVSTRSLDMAFGTKESKTSREKEIAKGNTLHIPDGLSPYLLEGDVREESELIRAAQAGDIKKTRELLSYGVDVDGGDINGYPALRFAALNGHNEIVEELLKKGADPNERIILKGNKRMCMVGLAFRRDDMDLIRVLSKCGVNIKERIFYASKFINGLNGINFLMEYTEEIRDPFTGKKADMEIVHSLVREMFSGVSDMERTRPLIMSALEKAGSASKAGVKISTLTNLEALREEGMARYLLERLCEEGLDLDSTNELSTPRELLRDNWPSGLAHAEVFLRALEERTILADTTDTMNKAKEKRRL